MPSFSENPLLDAYERQVPRYTSYPTAPHFEPMDSGKIVPWLKAIPMQAAVSLYVHVPYCKALCWFCGCNTRITQRYEVVKAFLPLLKKEMALVAKEIGRRQEVLHLHFGGGSPTILEADDVACLMEAVRREFNVLKMAEIALEADPRGLSEAKIASYVKYGLNRISMGIQDFDAEVQVAVNRVQPLHLVYEKLQLCRDYGIRNISFDLMYGLPKQTLDSIQRTIDYAIMLAPNRISLFGYAHVPWKKKNIRLIDENELPDAGLRLAMFQLASNRLRQAGYLAVGLDHFAKPDDELAAAWKQKRLRRNFQGYTNDAAEHLIGFGPSAISQFKQGYTQNVTSPEAYEGLIQDGKLPVGKGIAISQQDVLRRHIIESLMCYMEADIAQLCADMGVPASLFDEVIAGLRPLQERGVLAIEGYALRVAPEYPQAVRLVCAQFDRYLNSGQGKHSQVA